MGYLRRKEGREGIWLVCFQFFREFFGQFVIWGWGGRMSYSRVSGLGGVSPSFFGLFLFFFFVPCKVKEPHKKLNTTLQTLQVSVHKKNHPVPRNLPINFIESSSPTQTHKQTNNESNLQKELEAGPFSWVYILGNKSASWEGCFRHTFATTTKQRTPCSTLYSNHNNSQQKPMSNFVF